MKMPGKCTGPKYLSENFGEWGKRHLGGHDLVRFLDRQGKILMGAGNAREDEDARKVRGPKVVGGRTSTTN